MRDERVGAELRKLRGNLTSRQVQDATGITPSKLSRLEGGVVRAKPEDITKLTSFYKVDQAVTERLIDQVRAARQPQWWTHFVGKDWDAALSYHLELETEAKLIESWMIDLVPGLLQTNDYVRALVEGRPDVDPEQTERRIELRAARRARVERGDLEVWAILSEAVLYQEIGGPGVLADQLRYLAHLDRITVQVLPFSAGAHPGLGSAFHLMHFPQWPSTVYQDTITRGLYQDDPRLVEAHARTMAHIKATARSPRESRKQLLSRAEELDARRSS